MEMELKNGLFNVDSLFLLERLPSESVDMVYLDPPWLSRGNAFYEPELDQYLFFLANRIQSIYRLLKRTGNIFFHTAPEASHFIRLLLDHYFGKENYRSQYVLPRPGIARFDPDLPRDDYSNILLYGKSQNAKYHAPVRPYTTAEIEARYPKADERGRYRLISLITPNIRPNLQFEWNGITPPEGRSWRFRRERLDQLYTDNMISFGLSNKIPSMKQYLDEEKGVFIKNIWDDLAKPIPARERTGHVAQQSVDLLCRIICIGSDENDVILDPFCGSGTTLVSASMLNRRWIGCDISSDIFDLAVDRMNNTLTENKVSFQKGNWVSVERLYPTLHKLSEPDFEMIFKVSKPIDFRSKSQSRKDKKAPKESKVEEKPDFETNKQDLIKPLILTEGKTDWKHLKAAFRRLKESGYLDESLDVDFDEQEEPIGDITLSNTCQASAKVKQPRILIFVFDRDNDKILRDLELESKQYRFFGNNVYSFAIPIPSFRPTQSKVSIEFYYPDNDLMRMDGEGRRLFLSSEFNQKTGRHNDQDLICIELNRLRGETKIIDSNVFDKENKNVALSKDDFAENILVDDNKFRDIDISEFVKIFGVIERIMGANDVH